MAYLNPLETQVVLAGLRDPSDLLRVFLAGGHSAKAGVIAGALRRFGRGELADEVIRTMRAAGYDARARDPFEAGHTFGTLSPKVSPIVGRVQAIWRSMRGVVAASFPEAPGLPGNRDSYLASVDDIYKSDAYHSLSIEGYRVTPELIERVQQGNWDPQGHEDDRRNRDALAARGYWQAFQKVKDAVADILAGANPGARARASHADWYRELSQPFVAAGVIAPTALAGYRNDAAHLRTSRYVPPRWEAVRDAMPALFDLLEHEDDAGVRAVLGHWLLGYIHPYPDGNGRLALRDERDACLWRLSLDGDQYRGSRRVSGGPRPRQHRYGYRIVHRVHRRTRAMVGPTHADPALTLCRDTTLK